MEDRFLFRGKRIDNGEWVEGYLSYPFCKKKGNESYYFYVKDSLGFFCRCVVDASTICRCTGREDMNGKLIFENDIVKCLYYCYGEKYVYIGKVIYREDICRFVATNSESTDFEWWDEEKEVIGNVFDNPELLESEE